MKRIFAFLPLLFVGNNTAVAAHDHESHAGHGRYAPIGVMGDHLHAKGDWMVSYRYMHMNMQGNLKGSNHISNSRIVSPSGENFLVAPTSMTMDMHMVGIMYAPSDKVTLMGMVPYLKKSMDHRTRAGSTFTTGSQGIGDVKLMGLYGIREWGQEKIHLNIGLSLPTGSINEKDTLPTGRARLPYPMQLGSGTYDFMPGLTYLGQAGDWSWGSQTLATIRLQSDNGNDYRLGNAINITGWFAKQLSDLWSASLRVDGQAWGDVHGADPQLNPAVVPTADPNLRGGKRIDLLAGVDYQATAGFFQGHRLAIEAGLPVWQNLDGPQLETDWTLTAGWQYVF